MKIKHKTKGGSSIDHTFEHHSKSISLHFYNKESITSINY